MSTPEADLNRIIARQHNVIARKQALAAGLTRRQVDLRVETGVWVVMHRAVYRPACARRSFQQSVMAACLAVGGVASHRCAARLWRLRGFESDVVEVTTVADRRTHLPGAAVHRARRLDRQDTTTMDAIAITTPARTLLDLAAVAPDLVEPALDDVLLRRLTSLGQIRLLLQRSGGRGRAGTALLGRLVDERDEGKAPTMSELEDQFLALVRRFGLPEPVRQYRLAVPGGELVVDFAHPPAKVTIELDGRRWHGSRRDARRDRQRDRLVRAAGWEPVRICKDDMDEEPEAVAADIARLLSRRAA